MENRNEKPVDGQGQIFLPRSLWELLAEHKEQLKRMKGLISQIDEQKTLQNSEMERLNKLYDSQKYLNELHNWVSNYKPAPAGNSVSNYNSPSVGTAIPFLVSSKASTSQAKEVTEAVANTVAVPALKRSFLEENGEEEPPKKKIATAASPAQSHPALTSHQPELQQHQALPSTSIPPVNQAMTAPQQQLLTQPKQQLLLPSSSAQQQLSTSHDQANQSVAAPQQQPSVANTQKNLPTSKPHVKQANAAPQPKYQAQRVRIPGPDDVLQTSRTLQRKAQKLQYDADLLVDEAYYLVSQAKKLRAKARTIQSGAGRIAYDYEPY